MTEDWHRIRLEGRLDVRWVSWFDGMHLTCDGDGTTLLQGSVPDQAALHGLLAKVRDMGLPLVSVTRGSAPGLPPVTGSAMTDLPTTHFTTTRLRARSFHSSDVDPFTAYRADPEVARYQSWSDFTRERGEAFVASMRDASPGVPGQWFQLALEERSSGALVGDLAFKVDADEPREAEVGFTIASAHQGKGHATEALTGLLDHVFGTLRLHRVVAVTDALNAPAAALLERVGMRREGHFVENVFFKGAWGSELLFAILEREWSARR